MYRRSFTIGTDPRGIAIADLNLDGAPDVITANRGTSKTPSTDMASATWGPVGTIRKYIGVVGTPRLVFSELAP